MTRDELEHIIRASADLTDQYEFIIVGSQSILGPIPNPPEVFTMSAEADIYPLQAPELADTIDGAIGEGSQFHRTYGYYAQGVGPETALLPHGWIDRVHRVQTAATNQRVGYCLGEFCKAMLLHRYVKPQQALDLVALMPLNDAGQRRLKATIRRWSRAVESQGNDLPNE
jgi:hypothetical protein